MSGRLLFRGIGARIALTSLLVTGLAVMVIAAGVLGVGQDVFERLMVQHGATVALAREMFNQTVTLVFVGSAAVAALASILLAVLLARQLSRPLEEIGRAARRVAEGDLVVQVPRQGPDEVVSLADSFNQMAQSLQEQERLRREFIINAAHELRTPLTNLQGYLEALRDGVIAPDRETFTSLHEEADRLVRLSRSLDMLAAGDTGKGAPPAVECDLVPLIAAAVEMARPAFDRADIRPEVQLPECLKALANPDQLSQVLANLLQNAARYTPAGGRVSIAAEARRGDVLVSVTNTGDGIPASDLPHIFERFYRVEKSRDRARGGAGIGLAIVKQLVEATGGRVGAESKGGLTRFWFSLPA
jgi:two-component system sensor histidine kinase BaeS